MIRLVKGVLAVSTLLLVVSGVSVWAAGNQQPISAEIPELTIMANFWPVGMSEVSRLYFERLERENAVKVTWELPPTANYNERLQITLAGGEYPDVINFPGHKTPIFLDAVRDGAIMPITQYVQESVYLQRHISEWMWEEVRADPRNREIYLIPRPSIVRFDGWALRGDWLDNVGLSVPDDLAMTLDEFTEALRRFTYGDPNRSGRKDTYGITRGSADGYLDVIAGNAFDLHGWQRYEGEEYPYMDLRYSRVSDNFKSALEYTAMLWREGLVDPAWPNNRGPASQDQFIRGEAGVFHSFPGHLQEREVAIRQNAPGARLTHIVGVENSKGVVRGLSTVGAGVWGGWAITSTNQYPAKSVAIFDWAISDAAWSDTRWGYEGVSYTVENDGTVVATPEYTNQSRWGGFLGRRDGDPTFFVPLSLEPQQRQRVEYLISLGVEAAVISLDLGFRPPVTSEARFIDAQDELNQTITRIIVGELPVSAYDTALDGWYKAGGEEYVRQMNEHIQSRQ